MYKKFVFKLDTKSIKLNLNHFDYKKITLKFIGIYNKIKFNSKVIIILKNNFIEKINIVELDIDESCYDEYSNYNFHSIYKSPIDLSLSSCFSNVYNEEIYNQVMKFIKNIKLVVEKNKLTSIIFSLKKTNIKKIKIKGKIN